MRKKILSVLLALCMVLALLPVAAFAAKLTDAQVAELKAKGYTDEQIDAINAQIADYESDEVVLVFEDTTITEAESRLVVVVAPQATVTVDGAKLDTGIVVAPGAADAKVVLKAAADVNAVVVLDKAEVVVEKEAKATNVTLAAAEAAATVEGSVDTVAVHEVAEKATVTVAEGAAVAAVEVAAPEAKADIAGTVSTVVVAETAKGAETTVAETATVSAVEVAAPEAKAEIAGSVSTVTVAETAKGAETTVASTATVSAVTVAAPEAKTDVAGTVETVTVAETAEGAGTTVSGTVSNVTVDAPNTKTDVAETGSVGSVNVGENATGTEINAADGANVGEVTDPAGNNTGNTSSDPAPSASPSPSPAPVDPEPEEPVQPALPALVSGIKKAPLVSGNSEQNDATKPDNGLAATYTVTPGAKVGDAYKVVIKATGAVKHTTNNSNPESNVNQAGYAWVGIAIPKEAGKTYTYAQFKYNTDGTHGNAAAKTPTDHMTVDGVEYDTFYYGFNEELANKSWQLQVTVTSADAGSAEQRVAETYFLDLEFHVEVAADVEEDEELTKSKSTEPSGTSEAGGEDTKTEEPKTDETNTEVNNTEVTNTDENKTDENKTEEPKTDEPKTDENKTDENNTEGGENVEGNQPDGNTPSGDTGSTTTPDDPNPEAGASIEE